MPETPIILRVLFCSAGKSGKTARHYDSRYADPFFSNAADIKQHTDFCFQIGITDIAPTHILFI